MSAEKKLYKDLIKGIHPFSGEGVTGYLMKQFEENDFDVDALLELIEDIDFSLFADQEDIPVSKKVDIVKNSAERSLQTSPVMKFVMAIIPTVAFALAGYMSIVGNSKCLMALQDFADLLSISNSAITVAAVILLLAIVVIAILMCRLDTRKTRYLDALDYLKNMTAVGD